MRLFIYCSDPREEADLENKINKSLILPGEKVMRITTFGGPIFLAHPIVFRSQANTMLDQIRFAIEKFKPEKIVLVGHNCGFYQEDVSLSKLSVEDKKRDIFRIRKMLDSRHSGQAFKAYFDISNEQSTKFENLSA